MKRCLLVAILVALALAMGGCEAPAARPGDATAPGNASPTATRTPRGGPTAAPSPAVALPQCSWTKVTRVVDGDTVHAIVDGRDESIRYIGMDTPELHKPGVPVQPFAREASARNSELVLGRWVCLERDVSDRDRYGRLLRYFWLEDGRLVNEVLVREGFALVATFPPDVKYTESRLLPAQRAAREDGVGLWVGQ